jgi:hypothetical protein
LTQTFPIKSNGSWKIVAQGSSPWVTASPDHGTGDGLLTFNIEQNFAIVDRTAKFVCLLNDNEQRSIYISQKAFSPKIEITADKALIPGVEGTVTFKVATEVAWKYRTNVDWLTEVEKTDSTLTLRAAENSRYQPRQATLTFGFTDYPGETQQVITQQDSWGTKGLWLFDAPILGLATIGQNLTPVGSGMTVVSDGPNGTNSTNRAVHVIKGEYYICNHGLPGTNGGAVVSDYTLMFDIRITTNVWYSFYQTTLSNGDDAEFFINTGGGIGIGGQYAGKINLNTWHRVVITRTVATIAAYIDGVMVISRDGTDSRFNLNLAGVLFFADNDGDDGDIDVAEIALWDRSLSAEEAARLGKAGNSSGGN